MTINNQSLSEMPYKDMANAIRTLSMDAVEQAKSGHPGMPMGMADVATVLFSRFLKYQANDTKWPDRDRFVLSAGHGSMLLYASLYLMGVPGMDLESLKNFRQLGANTAGHPEYGHAEGIETTTGPLGQGLANAVGMAIAEKSVAERYGHDLCDHHTYVIAGDGCLMEGISQEAISLAGHLKLGKLIVLFDDNQISIDGSTDLATSEDQQKRFEASGWHVVKVDGHDFEAIEMALQNAKNVTDKPSMIACRTKIGYGAPNKQGTAGAHGAPLGAEEIAATREALNWPHPPFEIPENILAAWRVVGTKNQDIYEGWQERAKCLSPDEFARLSDPIDENAKAAITQTLGAFKERLLDERPKIATRVASKNTLEQLVPILPCLIGGSADLTGSNGTLTSHHSIINADDFRGNYMHYGVREHGMAAAMNGMALHGGVVPYGATFLVFTDYCRPSIRLSALMEQRVVYVMTHDSIGLGEDGPTHQPVEHLAALRAMPNVRVFRPADSLETAECWELALLTDDAPSVLALTRQGLPTLRNSVHDNETAKGGYVLYEPESKRDITLLATGSEVALALAASQKLKEDAIHAAVVSMPCFELFEQQPQDYRDVVLGDKPRIAIEAACQFGWDRWIGEQGTFIGMNSFGASAPAKDLYNHFNITEEHIIKAAKSYIWF
ncbi:MAG: transketolase [Pseudomonadota bacterium]